MHTPHKWIWALQHKCGIVHNQKKYYCKLHVLLILQHFVFRFSCTQSITSLNSLSLMNLTSNWVDNTNRFFVSLFIWEIYNRNNRWFVDNIVITFVCLLMSNILKYAFTHKINCYSSKREVMLYDTFFGYCLSDCVEEDALRLVLLPRPGAGEAQVWPPGMEHPVRVQRDRSQDQRQAARYVPEWIRGKKTPPPPTTTKI